MDFLIIFIIFFASLHFVYEGIVAPSFRMKLNFELFRLRDNLRSLKISHRDELDDKHYYYLQDSINALIRLLPKLDITTLSHVRRLVEQDPKLKARAMERSMILDDCKLQEAREIRKKTLKIAYKVLLVSAGAWFIYLIPILLVYLCYKAISDSIKTLVSLSDSDFDRVIPGDLATA